MRCIKMLKFLTDRNSTNLVALKEKEIVQKKALIISMEIRLKLNKCPLRKKLVLMISPLLT